jgi:PAS domain S-box-containing protein
MAARRSCRQQTQLACQKWFLNERKLCYREKIVVIELSRYVFETLREDGELALCRGRRDEELSTVLIVAPLSEYPAPKSIKLLEHEYSFRDELDPDWAVRPLALARREGRMTLVLEDPGGEPLDRLLGQPMELGRFLRFGVGLTAALGKLHHRGLIHKDIKPVNILVDSATFSVWLTGFGIASRLPRERQSPEPPEVIAGTLAYMAPEQTGRMNRSIDSRSDLYSVGVTFYEMLTGVLPFKASDPMEWIHCHVARQPPSLTQRVEQIPESISALVMKLLAKTAEERYQTAAGVEADLRRCLAEWECRGQIEPFPLGQHDMPDRLLIPEKLYGRDSECNALLAAFDRIVASGIPELVLVSGYSGIGKSSVVNELHKAIVLPRGIFISGKFDQHRRDIPYSTFAQAFQGLVRQILSKSEEEVNQWRDAMLGAVGTNGQLVVNLIPELELLIGKQSPLLELPPQEAQNRFDAVLRRFIGAFARKEHPLALFLDDLQWMDPASLKLLEQLVTHPEIRHLLVIGAYRDNEVTADHPLILTLDAIRRTQATVIEIVLQPLSLEDVNQVLGDALRCEAAQAKALAELVQEKTGGNPFFAIQFLGALAEEYLLEFDARAALWRWDAERIRAKAFTDNVVDLMVGKLQRLSRVTQEALKQLACLGNSAEIATLTTVLGGSQEEACAALFEAIQAGLVLPVGTSYKFLHDRVQEAAYALVPEDERVRLHLQIGRRLISEMSPREIEEKIFEVVNQLNGGLRLISDLEEKERVAELNLAAGRRAKATTAYGSACIYLAAGMDLLGSQSWKRKYQLSFALYLERAECEFLNGNFELSERLVSELLERAATKVDKAAAYRQKISLHMMQAEPTQAVQSGLDCLCLFGIEIQAHPSEEEVQREYEEVWRNLSERSIEDLADLPLMDDSEMEAVIQVLWAIFFSGYFTDRNLRHLVLCHMVNVTVKHGTTDASALAYSGFGVMLGPIFHRYRDGERFTKLAIDVAEKYGFSDRRVGAYFGMQMASLWNHPINKARAFLETAIRVGVEYGDVVYACYSFEHAVTDRLAQGDPLDQVWLESARALDFVQKAKFRHVADAIITIQHFVQGMRGEEGLVSTSKSGKLNESASETRVMEGPLPINVCWYWILKLRARFLMGDYQGAIEAAQKAKPLLWTSEWHIQLVDYCFYGALAILAVHETTAREGKTKWLAELNKNLERLREWAENCSDNFLDKYNLVLAEVARSEGRDLDAMRLYEEAIRTARENGFVQEEALANELAARFYENKRYQTIAETYLRNARSCYLRWGAISKVKQLDQSYPAIGEQPPLDPSTTIGTPTGQLDLETVIKASQAVSGEILLEQLIETLMVLVLEHAGAERGILFLPHGEDYRIEAEARSSCERVTVRLRQETVTPSELPESVLRYVIRTRERVILDDASIENLFFEDEYIRQKGPRSVLCIPLVKQVKLVGVLYLENNLAPGVFTMNRVTMLELLASQAAISLDHAQLYADLRQENSDRRKAEEALRASEERLQDIIDNTSAVIFVKDLELRFILVNHEFERRHCVERDQIRGKTDFDILPYDVAVGIRANDRRVIEGGVPIQFEETVPWVEGKRSYVSAKFLLRDQTGKPYAVCGIATDITALKHAEEMQAAIAREQEMLARRRATELAKANEALRGSLDALATVPELDEFIGQVMATITRQLGAVSSALRVLNAEQNSMTLELLFQDGRVMSPAEAKYPECWQSTSLEELRFASLEGPVTVLRLADSRALNMPEGLRIYLLGLNVKTLLLIPLTSRGQANGFLSFRFTDERDFHPEELEIVRALATHASLAIQLTRLAKAARQSAVLEERNRLAGEIHDALAQSFTGISMQLGVAQEEMAAKEGDPLCHIRLADEMAQFGLAEAQRSVLSLRSSFLRESGFVTALQRLVERSNVAERLRCDFRSDSIPEERLPPRVQHELLRIAQEAISNAVRHARPTLVIVTLRWDPPNLILQITDNGSGFSKARLEKSDGVGLGSMRERAAQIDAKLEIQTAVGQGTSIIMTVPIT